MRTNRSLDYGFIQMLTMHPYHEYGLERIQAGRYFFEDDKERLVDLQAVWNKDSLRGKLINMFIRQCHCYWQNPECKHVSQNIVPWRTSDMVETVAMVDFGITKGQRVLPKTGLYCPQKHGL